MKIGLYVHIPFCKSKCYYCDFLSFSKDDKMAPYVDALVKELVSYGKQINGVHTISSIFIGGGTPTVLSPFLLQQVCETINQYFSLEEDLEWTIEANPGTVTDEHIEVFAKVGINRVSLGLQACQNTLLKAIGRIHLVEDWRSTIEKLQKANFTNLNTDIMFGLPGQTVEDFKETLSAVTEMGIPHISAYSLIIEEGTVFYKRYEKNQLQLPEEDAEREMYEVAKKYLQAKGYEQYEISNWAKGQAMCRHNVLYWEQGYYLGIGLGAHSYMDHVRYSNTTCMDTYIKANGEVSAIVEERETITEKMAMEEFMFLGLRMNKGVSLKTFEQRFHKSLFEIYGDVLDHWIKENILVHHKDSIYLSERGVEISNQVFTSFL